MDRLNMVAVPFGTEVISTQVVFDVLTEQDKVAVANIAEMFATGESKEIAGKSLLNESAKALKALLERGLDSATKLPKFEWYKEVSAGFVSCYMTQQELEEYQRNTADKAWSRAYERAGFSSVPKATNAKALEEQKRREKIKAEKQALIDSAKGNLDESIRIALDNGESDKVKILLDAKEKAKKDQDKAKIEGLKDRCDKIVAVLRKCSDVKVLIAVEKALGMK